MLTRAPTVIEKCLNVDYPVCLSIFRQKEFTTHMDLRVHLRCREKASTHAHTSPGVRIWEGRDVRALGWCPGAIVLSLQFQLLVFYKQPKHIVPIWDALECDFCTLPEVSGMGQDGSESAHDLDRGFDGLSVTIMLCDKAIAHRLPVLGR